MLSYLEFLLVGFYALIKGADIFVDGSSSLAKRFHVPGLIIGLTIVAMGTSAPELAVSVSAALRGSNEIAVSNVIGSNLFNVLVVLGVCSLITPIPVTTLIIKRDHPINIGITVFILAAAAGLMAKAGLFSGKALSGLAMSDQVAIFGHGIGIALVVIFVIYMIYLVADAKKHPAQEEETGEIMPLPKCIFSIIFGAVLIVSGGETVVYAAKNIARLFGMSETLIGLTVVALGTSLPELVTSIVASRKGEVDMAVGNVVGSDIFNILLILGLSCAIHPVGINLASVYDMVILLGVNLICLIFCATGKRINRAEGATMLLIYIADVIFAYLRDVG